MVGTDIVNKGLIVLFFSFFIFGLFSVGPSLEIFLPTPLRSLPELTHNPAKLIQDQRVLESKLLIKSEQIKYSMT